MSSSSADSSSSKKRKREDRTKFEKASSSKNDGGGQRSSSSGRGDEDGEDGGDNDSDNTTKKTIASATATATTTAATNAKQQTASEMDPRTKLILDVKEIMRKRDKVRLELTFSMSEQFRDQLSGLGVEVVDQKHGPSGWKFKDGSSKKLPPGVDLPVDPNRVKVQNNNSNNNNSSNNSNNSNSKGNQKGAGASAGAKVPSQMATDSSRAQEVLNAMKPQLKSNQRLVQGVLIEDVTPGMRGADNPVSKVGDKIKVHYIGRLKSNNKIFDQSRNKPFQFTLGRGEVIRGWDIGCAGMAVGAQRILTIPPEKGYGLRGSPPVIPGNAALVFEVTLIDIHSKRK